MLSLNDRVRDWQRRAARYRQFSILLGADETAGRLRALALDMEQQLEKFRETAAAAEERKCDNAILLAEIDTFLARAQGAMFFLRTTCCARRGSAPTICGKNPGCAGTKLRHARI